MTVLNKVKNRTFIIYFILLNIMSVFMEESMANDYFRLGAGVILFILLTLLSIHFGFLGAIISIVYNGIGSYFVINDYLISRDRLSLGVVLFLYSSVLTCIIVAWSVERFWKNEKILKSLSIIDLATGANNYHSFIDNLSIEISRVTRSNECLSLVIFSVDGIKNINDLFGFKYGDEILRESIKYIKNQLREYDQVYRYEGNTFCLLLPDTNSQKCEDIVQRIKENLYQLNSLVFIKKNNVAVSFSIGYSSYPEMAENSDHLVVQASSAHYNAKQSGRNQSQVFFDIFLHVKKSMLGSSDHFMESLKVILWTLTSKDFYTYGHSERVARYSLLIGKKIGLDNNMLNILEIAALLHDVGKINIPLEILNKRSPLSEDEFSAIRRHSEDSRRILEPLNGFENLLDAVESHHEFYNGAGYPNGLVGEQIPLFARIICIADSFDAMRSERPYSPSYTIEEATNEILENLGRQFDPKLGYIFVKECLPNYSLI